VTGRRGLARRGAAVALGAAVYLVMVGSLGPWAVAQGVLIACAALLVARPLFAPGRAERTWSWAYLARLLGRSGRNVVRGSWAVGLTAAGLRPVPRPAWIEVPVAERSPGQPDVVALLETFSPGTYLVDHDEERGVMLFHVFDEAGAEPLRRSLLHALGHGERADEPSGGTGEAR
jgi:multisubunit Na+/H+ antiporter MnhE subunit